MEAVGISTVVFSSPWEWLQPDADGPIRNDYLELVAASACNNTNMKVAWILDMVRAPAWVFDKWPDAKAMDSHARQYQLLSWFHPEANKMALEVLGAVVVYLVTAHPGCVTAVQPAYNNEYEAKYTQEHDCYQDYSIPAVSAFRQWLQARKPQLEDVNGRWATSFKSWEEVSPPVLEAGSFLGADVTSRYWDFLKFREMYGAGVLNRACGAVQSAGAACFHHVPEIFTVLVAVYGTTMFKHIAASPNTDFIVVDSNFFTPYGTIMSPAKLRLFVSAAQSYGKPVQLGATVQQFASTDLLTAGFRHAILAGASGVGVTNWLPHLALNASLTAVLHPLDPALHPGDGAAGAEAGDGCRQGMVPERTGLFIHLDSCAAWHGLQWGGASKDPLHDFTQDLADRLATDCGPPVAVFLEFDRLLAALPSLDRVLFVEPLVLTGSAEFEAYSLAKAAVKAMPHELIPFPINHSSGVLLTILQDL